MLAGWVWASTVRRVRAYVRVNVCIADDPLRKAQRGLSEERATEKKEGHQILERGD